MEKINAQVETITPELAKKYLLTNSINRPINAKVVSLYASYMQKGQWKLNGEAICFDANGVLLNGQHRLSAIVESGCSTEMLVVRGCEEDSFATYDSGKNRSIADVFAISEIQNYSKISSCVNKAYFYQANLVSVSRSGSHSAPSARKRFKLSKIDFLNEYKSSPNLYQRAVTFTQNLCLKLKLLNESEVSGFYVYAVKFLKHEESMVQSFLEMLFKGEHVSNNTISLFREKVIQDRLGNNSMTPRYKQALFAKTWNAYVTGKHLKVLSWTESREGKITFK